MNFLTKAQKKSLKDTLRQDMENMEVVEEVQEQMVKMYT